MSVLICVLDSSGKYLFGDCDQLPEDPNKYVLLKRCICAEVLLMPAPNQQVTTVQIIRVVSPMDTQLLDLNVRPDIWFEVARGSLIYSQIERERTNIAARAAGIEVTNQMPPHDMRTN